LKIGYCALIALLVIACNNKDKAKNNISKDSVVTLNDTVPLVREKVNAEPVTTYNEQKGDAGIDVKVYETSKTFRYLMKVKYHGHDIADTLKIPNFGIAPAVALKKGDTDHSCIVGFLDKDKAFKEYKLVSATGDNLNIKILKRYAVASYRADE